MAFKKGDWVFKYTDETSVLEAKCSGDTYRATIIKPIAQAIFNSATAGLMGANYD